MAHVCSNTLSVGSLKLKEYTQFLGEKKITSMCLEELIEMKSFGTSTNLLKSSHKHSFMMYLVLARVDTRCKVL